MKAAKSSVKPTLTIVPDEVQGPEYQLAARRESMRDALLKVRRKKAQEQAHGSVGN